MALATTSLLGQIKLAGDLAGNIDGNFPELRATGVTPGAYPVITSLVVDTKGRVVFGYGMNSTYMLNILPKSTATVVGYVSSVANTSNLVITNGAIDTGVDIAHLGVFQTFTKAQATAIVDISPAPTYTPDFSASNSLKVNLTGNITLNDPTGSLPGGVYTLALIQDAVGGRTVTLAGTNFKIKSPFTMSTSPNGITLLTLIPYNATSTIVMVSTEYI